VTRRRWFYVAATIVLFLAEVAIALFVHDTVIRPYAGDSIVVIMVYTAIRAVTPFGVRAAAFAAFLFACAVEIGQYFHLVDRIGLGHNAFVRTILGTTFVPEDFLAYAIGALVALAAERTLARYFRSP
jgi:hypothetical protein